jgi:hypothetical protein
MADPHPERLGDVADEQPGVPVSLSVVIVVTEKTRDLAGSLATLAGMLSSPPCGGQGFLVSEHEVIVVVNCLEDTLDTDTRDVLQRAANPAAPDALRVLLLTRQVHAYAAAWHGIENARGNRVAVLDSATDDVGFLPELLRKAAAGADLVFAQDTDRAPPRLSRAVARRLLDTVQRSLDVTLEAAAPRYRVLGENVVRFIAQHPDPVEAYRRLPAGSSFTRAHLQYRSRTRAPRDGHVEQLTRGTRRWLWTTLDVLTSWRGNDTTFVDPAGGDTVCLTKLANLGRGAFEIPARFLERDAGWFPANPTIARLGQRTWVNVRLVNYRKQGHGSKISGDGVYRSRNVVLDWAGPHGVANEPITAAHEAGGVPTSWPAQTRVRGLEDQRWIVHEGRLWFSACCCQVPHDEGRAQMVLGRLNEALDGVDHLVPIRYDAARDAEKNWLLWSLGGELLAIYGYQPFTLLKLDPATGRARPFRAQRADFPARRLRGSAGPLPVPEHPGHWLVLVHEVARRFERPVYAHRWLLVHLERGMVAHSRPFVFDHVGIEYAAGLLDNGDGTLTVTYGFEDREARWVVLDRASVLASLYGVRQLASATAGKTSRSAAPIVSSSAFSEKCSTT